VKSRGVISMYKGKRDSSLGFKSNAVSATLVY
jgi:hypothetical protein